MSLPLGSLRARLARPPLLLVPGIFDGLSALIAERAGAEALYLSGASIAYTRLGRPDLGLVTMTEVAEVIAQLRDRVSLPLLVDADTGFGNALNVQRTVRLFERAGAQAIQLEDQTLPKRCGHLDGKTLVATGEMVGKIKAAVDARQSGETLIVARTDALALEGLSAALERAARYVEAGADVLFVEAPQSETELRAIGSALSATAPLLANMVEGGRTPLLPAAALEAAGFSLAIYPGGLVRALARTAEAYLANLLASGSTEAFRGRMHDFQGLNDLLGTAELLQAGRRYEDVAE